MFYDNYVNLCNSVGKSPSAVAVELGFKKSAVTRWKRGSTPTDATQLKIADYFGITKESLMGNLLDLSFEQQIGFDDFTYAMHSESNELTEEDKSLLLAMAKQLSEKNRKNGKAE